MSSPFSFGSWGCRCGAWFGMVCVLVMWCSGVIAEEEGPDQSQTGPFWMLTDQDGAVGSRNVGSYGGLCCYDFHFEGGVIPGVEEEGMDIAVYDTNSFWSVTSSVEVPEEPGVFVRQYGPTAWSPIAGLPSFFQARVTVEYDVELLRPSVALRFHGYRNVANRIPGYYWRFYPKETAARAWGDVWVAADGSTLRLRPGRGYSLTWVAAVRVGAYGPDASIQGGRFYARPQVGPSLSLSVAESNTAGELYANGKWVWTFRCPDPRGGKVYDGVDFGTADLQTASHGPLTKEEYKEIWEACGVPWQEEFWETGFWVWKDNVGEGATLEPGGYSDPYVVDPTVSLNRTWQPPYFSSQPMTGRIKVGGGDHGIPELSWNWSTSLDQTGNVAVDGALSTGRELFRGVLLVSLTFTFMCLAWRVVRQY